MEADLSSFLYFGNCIEAHDYPTLPPLVSALRYKTGAERQVWPHKAGTMDNLGYGPPTTPLPGNPIHNRLS